MKIGVLVVAYNADQTIASVLDRIPASFKDEVAEILVLDDSSSDHTVEVAQSYRDDHPELPLTVLRPMAFMELMTDKDLYPQVAMWHLMPKLVGRERALPWLAADDLGAIAAKAFADPEQFVGADIPEIVLRKLVNWRVGALANRRIRQPRRPGTANSVSLASDSTA